MLNAPAHVLFLLVVVICMATACGWICRRSRTWGAIVAAGALLRLAAGLSLAAISYYRWPLFESLQAGDGFWALAPDARVYFQLASAGAAQPPPFVPAGSPSPAYVLALSTWFRGAGATLVSAVIFNVACYMVATLAIAWLLHTRARRLGTIVLGAFSFSPALLLTTSQVLKDAFFTMLIVVGCVGSLLILSYSRQSLSERPAKLVAGGLMAVVAVAAMAGVRAYFAVFFWFAVAIGLFVSLWANRKGHRASFVAAAALFLVFLWCAFAAGADAYYPYYRNLIARATGINLSLPAFTWPGESSLVSGPPDVQELGSALNTARTAFIASGGGTNLVRAPGQAVMDLAVGLAATYIPISILRATSAVTFDGGRGLLAITDLDTLFLDATLVIVGIVIFQSRAIARENLAALVFIVCLAAISSVMLAYVVTNFGTLFRLRLMVATPAWLAPLALTLAAGHTGVESAASGVGKAEDRFP